MLLAGWGRHGVAGQGGAGVLLYTNFATFGFWVLWFMALILLLPVVGRLWCTVCPVGGCNDLLARIGLKRAYPRRLNNYLLMAGLLLGLSLTAETFSFNRYPDLTAGLLLGLLLAAAAAGLIFRGRVFCRYWCPVGGMAGLYDRMAPVEIESRDRTLCRRCETKACYLGGTQWYKFSWSGWHSIFPFRRPGCPAFIFPPEALRNDTCLMCTQCFKNCPYDNLSWKSRPFLSGLWRMETRDRSEALLVVVLTGIVFYRLVRFWGGLRGLVDWPAEVLATLLPFMTPTLFKGTQLLFGFALWPLLFFLLLAFLAKAASEISFTPWPAGGEKTAGLLYDLAEIDEKRKEEEEGWDRKKHTLWGYLVVYCFSFLPLIAGTYAAFAVIKLNEKIGYLSLVLSDPAGVRSYLAINELQILAAPDALLPLEWVRWAALALVAAGALLSLWSAGRIGGSSYGPGSPAVRKGAPVFRVGIFALGGVFLYCVKVWLFRG